MDQGHAIPPITDCSIATLQLQAASADLRELAIRQISVSAWVVVVSLEQGDIAYLPALSIIQQSLQAGRSQSGPALISWEERGSVISNKERSWRNLQSAGNKIAFGLEKRLGNIKVYQWQSQLAGRTL